MAVDGGPPLGAQHLEAHPEQEGEAAWHALPLRGPHGDEGDLEQEIALRDELALTLGEILVNAWSDEERKYYISVEYVNCHEHAIVNTFDASMLERALHSRLSLAMSLKDHGLHVYEQ